MKTDVAVIGAGFAGLQAARAVADAGATVAVFEARDRVRGRSLSRRVGSATFDLGGQWMGPGQARLARLAQTLGAQTFPTYHQGTKLLDVGGKLRRYQGSLPSFSIVNLLILHQAMAWADRL